MLFERVPEGYAGAYPFVKGGQVIANGETRYTTLALKQVSGTFVLNQYQITLSIINTSPVAIEQIAITMTLLDRNDQVTGFRRMYLDPGRRLLPNESLTLTLKVIPQGANTVAFDAFAEGYRVPD